MLVPSEKLRRILQRLPDAATLRPTSEELSQELLHLSSALVAQTDGAATSSAQGFESGGGGLTSAMMYQRSADLVAAGLDALKALHGNSDAADLAPEAIDGLEAIILLIGRPALTIACGRPAAAPPEWEILETQRLAIEAVIRSVGRIELVGHPSYDWVGTGFIAADGVLMTNRHVATAFCVPTPSTQWNFVPGIEAFVNFAAEVDSPGPIHCRLTEVIGVHHAVDLALFRVEPVASDSSPIPSPLRIAAEPPSALYGRLVYLVGHPAWDGYRNDPVEMGRIFANLFNLKRLQPGMVMGLDEDRMCLTHDASSLGGNSGSCLLDLDRHDVLGLHYGGRYLEANYALPLWKLRHDNLLARAGIRFS